MMAQYTYVLIAFIVISQKISSSEEYVDEIFHCI